MIAIHCDQIIQVTQSSTQQGAAAQNQPSFKIQDSRFKIQEVFIV